MAVPTNTYQTYQQIGRREDLENAIYMISPTETPVLTMAKRSNAKQTLHEWQTDALAAAASNAQIEGDDASAVAATPTVRLGNYTQISSKTVFVSGTAREIDAAGREDELAYQIAKRSSEIKRDIELGLTQNIASAAGAAGAARTSGSMESWIATNISHGAGGSTTGFSGGVVAAPTDGTQRALTEALLKTQIQACWSAGGQPDTVLVGPKNKAVVSGFTGISTQYTQTPAKDQANIIAAADVYVSDFGKLDIVPSRFNRDRTLLLLDMEYWAVAYLRTFRQWPIAKTGDAEKRQILAEWTLVAKNEKASGKVADLTTP